MRALTFSTLAHSHRALPRLGWDTVADLGGDGSPRTCESRQQRAEKRMVGILDQLLLERPVEAIATKNLVQQSFEGGSYRVG